MNRRVLLLMCLWGVLAGCDPAYDFDGSVVDTSGGPVAGADVDIRCPSGGPTVTTTDATGRFKYGRMGWVPVDCTIEVRSAGHVPWSSSVKDHCKRAYRSDGCIHIEADIVLTPSAPK